MDEHQVQSVLDAYHAELKRLRAEFETWQEAWLVKMAKLYGPKTSTVSIQLARGRPGSRTRRLWTRMERARVELEQFVRRHGDLTFSLETKRYVGVDVVPTSNKQNGTGAESEGLT